MMKKSKFPWRLLFGGLIFLGGFGVLLYPAASNLWNDYRQSRLIQQYDRSVTLLEEADYAALWEAARTYNAGLSGYAAGDAFGAESETDSVYEAVLNPSGNGIMGYLSIPKIEVYLPVYHGTGTEELQNGIGHLYGTSLPVGGEGTHAVLAGHRGLPSAALLTDLDQLEAGDYFYLYMLDEVLAYEVIEIQVVEPTQTESLAAVAGEDLVTLVTCTPYGVNTHRLLVTGSRVEYTPKVQAEVTAEAQTLKVGSFAWMAYVLPAIGIVFVLLLILALHLWKRHARGGGK